MNPYIFCVVPGISPLLDFLKELDGWLRPVELLVALAVVYILGVGPWAAAREPALRERGTFSPEVQRRVRRAATGFFLLSGFTRVFLLAQGFNAGRWFGVEFWLNVHAVLFATPIGFAAWFRPLLLWGMGQLEQFSLAPRLRQQILAGLLVALLLTFPITAHALDGPGSPLNGWMAKLVRTLHLFAWAAWIGGLAVLAVSAAKVRASGGTVSRLVPALRRFFTVTLPVLVVGWGTGLLLAWMRLTAWRDLWTTREGLLLTGKLALATLALLLAAGIRFRVLPHVDAKSEVPGEGAGFLLVWALRLELGVALILMILGGVLASISLPS